MANFFIKSLLLQAKEVLSDEIEMLELLLVKEKLSGLKIIAKDLRIHLTGATQKQDIIEHLMCMAHIGVPYRKTKVLILMMVVLFLTSPMKRSEIFEDFNPFQCY